MTQCIAKLSFILAYKSHFLVQNRDFSTIFTVIYTLDVIHFAERNTLNRPVFQIW